MWEIRIQHEGLRACRVLKGLTQADAQWKAVAQAHLWDTRWSAQQAAESARNDLLTRQMLALHGHSTAARLTAEAAAHRIALKTLLATSLDRGLFFCWDLLKDTTAPADLPASAMQTSTPPPLMLQTMDVAQLSLLERLLQSRRARKELLAGEHFARDLAAWQVTCAQQHRAAAADLERQAEERIGQLARHRAAQIAQHALVDENRAAFEAHDPDAIEYFFSEVLSRSAYPDGFPQEAALEYLGSTRTLVIDYELPSFATWPTCKQMVYLPSQRTLQKIPLSGPWTTASYEDALYQIALRCLNELFLHDDCRALDRIAFNGWVRSIDKATGNIAHPCVLTLLVTRSAFQAINLSHVDPGACFLRLKGVASPFGHVPIRPIMPRPVADHRTPEAPRDKAGDLGTAVDLSSIARSDLETLIL